MKLAFSSQTLKNTQTSNFTKTVQWEPSFSVQTDRQVDGRTDMTKLVVAFHNFVNGPKKAFRLLHCVYMVLYQNTYLKMSFWPYRCSQTMKKTNCQIELSYTEQSGNNEDSNIPHLVHQTTEKADIAIKF
jgi:hypothetical protein